MPQLPPDWNNSAAQASLAPVASSPEYYIPLWWYSGAPAQFTNTTSAQYLTKGITSLTSTTTSSAIKLHTLNSNWVATTKFAIEVSLWVNSTSYTVTLSLYDLTAGAIVNGSSISTNSTTATVLRSGQFTLTPGHVYGVTVTAPSTSCTTSITDASLIVFPQ